MPFLDLDDISIHYIVEGDSGPAIVWIPGGDAIAESYRPMMKKLHGFRNISLDPCGAGETRTTRPAPWTIEQMADDVAALIRKECDGPVVATGISMGALITQMLAIRHPDLIRCGIPMGTTADVTGYLRDWMVAEVEFRRQGFKMTKEFAITHYGGFLYSTDILGDDEQWARIYKYMDETYSERDDSDFINQWQACIDYDVTKELPLCDVPLHVIAFDADLQTSPARGRRVADLAKNSTFNLLPGGHIASKNISMDAATDLIAGFSRKAYGLP